MNSKKSEKNGRKRKNSKGQNSSGEKPSKIKQKTTHTVDKGNKNVNNETCNKGVAKNNNVKQQK